MGKELAERGFLKTVLQGLFFITVKYSFGKSVIYNKAWKEMRTGGKPF